VDENDYTRPDLTEPKKLIALLVERGVRLINISIANPRYNPHYGRPYVEPVIGAYQSPEHPLAGIGRLISLAGEIQQEFNEIAVVGTGYSWLRTLMPNVAAASKANGLASIIGVGRMAFAYPDFAKDIILKGRLDAKKVCIACSKCSQIMINGGMIGCVVRDRETYGPIYKQGRKKAAKE
jgi:2,4-dienoyl-CoA reductase-like NADH-dependent reductase (Old Yellow Enzyme family)